MRYDEESRGGICWAELFRSFWGPERFHPRRRPTVGVGAAPSRGANTFTFIPRGSRRGSDRSLRLRRRAFGATGSDLHRTGPTVPLPPLPQSLLGPRVRNDNNRTGGREGVAGGWRSVGQRATVASGVGWTEPRRRSRLYSEDSALCGGHLVSVTLCRAGATKRSFLYFDFLVSRKHM